MGVILPFSAPVGRRRHDPIAQAKLEAEALVRLALAAGRDRRGVLAAAWPLLTRLRDRYGISVMQSGLPTDPQVLGKALLALSGAASLLDPDLGGICPAWCLGAYLGRSRLGWLEDSYGGSSGLAVPTEPDPAELAALLRHRLQGAGVSPVRCR